MAVDAVRPCVVPMRASQRRPSPPMQPSQTNQPQARNLLTNDHLVPDDPTLMIGCMLPGTFLRCAAHLPSFPSSLISSPPKKVSSTQYTAIPQYTVHSSSTQYTVAGYVPPWSLWSLSFLRPSHHLQITDCPLISCSNQSSWLSFQTLAHLAHISSFFRRHLRKYRSTPFEFFLTWRGASSNSRSRGVAGRLLLWSGPPSFLFFCGGHHISSPSNNYALPAPVCSQHSEGSRRQVMMSFGRTRGRRGRSRTQHARTLSAPPRPHPCAPEPSIQGQ